MPLEQNPRARSPTPPRAVAAPVRPEPDTPSVAPDTRAGVRARKIPSCSSSWSTPPRNAPGGRSARTRERIAAVARANPGIHTARLAVLLGLSWNAVQHHVRRMERAATIITKRLDGRICVFDTHMGFVSNKPAMALLRDPTYRRIVAAILKHPGCTQAGLARRLDLSTTAMHRRIGRLEETGMVRRLREGRTALVLAADELADAFVQAGLRTPAALEEATQEQGPNTWFPAPRGLVRASPLG